MDILYNVIREPMDDKVEYLRNNSEIPTSVYEDVFNKGVDYEKLLNNILDILGNDSLNEFLDLMPDSEKLKLIDNYRRLPRICLPSDLVMKHNLNRAKSVGHIYQAVLCNNHDLFLYLMNRFLSPGVYYDFFTGVAHNPSAIEWMTDIVISSVLILVIFTSCMSIYSVLAAHAKYVFDITLNKLKYTPEELADKLLSSTSFVKNATITKCEILYLSGYFDFEYFVGLAEHNKDVKYWIDLTNV